MTDALTNGGAGGPPWTPGKVNTYLHGINDLGSAATFPVTDGSTWEQEKALREAMGFVFIDWWVTQDRLDHRMIARRGYQAGDAQ